MRKPHLYALTVVARLFESFGSDEGSGEIAGALWNLLTREFTAERS